MTPGGADNPNTPTGLARILVRRHPDIGFVHAYVRREFGHSPSREKIEAMRAEWLRKEGRGGTPKQERDNERNRRKRDFVACGGVFNCGHPKTIENLRADGDTFRCRTCVLERQRASEAAYRQDIRERKSA